METVRATGLIDVFMFVKQPVVIPVYGREDAFAAAADDIRHQRHKVVCWNDSPDIADVDGVQAMMQSAFDVILSRKSLFEL